MVLIPIRFAPAAIPGGRRRAWSASQREPAKPFCGTSRRVWYYSLHFHTACVCLWRPGHSGSPRARHEYSPSKNGDPATRVL